MMMLNESSHFQIFDMKICNLLRLAQTDFGLHLGLQKFFYLDWQVKGYKLWALTLSQTSPGFYMSAVQVFCKHCACYEQFFLFPWCFLPFRRTFCHVHQIQNCRLQTLLNLEESKICCSAKD